MLKFMSESALWLSSCTKNMPLRKLRVPMALASALIIALKLMGIPGTGQTVSTGPIPTRTEDDALAPSAKPSYQRMR